MILISHRGNLDGPNPARENSPEYITEALADGFEVEVDVWAFDNDFYLGHDRAQYPTTLSFLSNPRIWCHTKNLRALDVMRRLSNTHCFWHQNDDFTLTSRGYIWTYPNHPLTPNSICVMPELGNYSEFNCAGICSDKIRSFRGPND